jgi:low affinity Fe/Cu permease
MKHLQAGLMVGAILLAVAVVTVLVWALFSFLVGDTAATVIVIVLAVIIILATFIDWASERFA